MSYTESGIYIPPLPQSRPLRDGRARRRETHLYMGLGAVIDPDGSVAWQEDDWTKNVLADEGENDMLAVYLTAATNPSKFLCLINGGTTPPSETSTMAYLGGGAGAQETQVPGANGYNRQQILTTDWTNDGLQGGDFRYSAAEKTFGAATATWTITHSGLVTASTGQTAGSGKFLAFIPLSATTTIASGQSFKYIMRWTQS